MMNGEAIHPKYVHALLAFLSQRSNPLHLRFDEVIVHSVRPATRREEGGWAGYRQMRRGVRASLSIPFQDTERHYVADPEVECPEIATAFYIFLGRMDDPTLPDDDARRRGEEIRGLSLDMMTAWLKSLHDANHHTIMYAVLGEQQVAAMVSIPVSEQTFNLLSTGQMRPEQITPEEFSKPTTHVWLEMITPLGVGMCMSTRARSRSEIWTFLYQLAYFSHGIRPLATPFTLFTNPVFKTRLERFAFGFTGHTMQGTDFPIVVAKRRAIRLLAAFTAPYRRANRRVWALQ